jgi:hypothetical protein
VWAPTLNHEILDDAMEVKSVVEPVFDEFDEISHSVWGTSVKEFDGDVSC